jgi:AraC-like DNA-binding protein
LTETYPFLTFVTKNVHSTKARQPAPDFFSTQVSEARRFFLDLRPSPKIKLSVVSGGREHCAPEYSIRRDSFPFCSVEYVVQGSGTLKLNRSPFALQPGSVFAYGPGVPQEIITDREQPLVKYFVDFNGTEASKLLKDCRLRPGTLSQVYPPGEIQPLFDELIRNGQRGTRQSPGICAHLLEALVAKILDARAPLPGRETLAFATYQRCRDHIARNFLRLQTLEDAAADCHVDASYLCRLFQRYDDQTPYRFLIRLKMNHAAERLRSPEVLVKQVAEETGFSNQFHFSRVFKSVFHLSPRRLVNLR